MASSTTPLSTPSSSSMNETALQDYMRHFDDYLENGMNFTELSQIRQLDIHLQKSYGHLRELVDTLRQETDDEQEPSRLDHQTALINALIQAKCIGDKKMELSQKMLDAAERQSKKLKIAHQKYVETMTQQNTSVDQNPNDNDSDHEYDGESGPHRSLSAKASTTSLWKRKINSNSSTASSTGINVKRKTMNNSEQTERSSHHESTSIASRDRKKPTQRNMTPNTQTNISAYGRKLKLNNESSGNQSDVTTYCLCSQPSYGSMILCDSRVCVIKWFHFNCVHLTTKPKGKWFCPNCRDNRT